jgi:hypothetical protein
VYTHSQEEIKPTLLEAIKGVELHEKVGCCRCGGNCLQKE